MRISGIRASGHRSAVGMAGTKSQEWKTELDQLKANSKQQSLALNQIRHLLAAMDAKYEHLSIRVAAVQEEISIGRVNGERSSASVDSKNTRNSASSSIRTSTQRLIFRDLTERIQLDGSIGRNVFFIQSN